MTRARTALVLLLALALAGAASLAPAPAAAQKPGGTLTIVRPTDPVSLDPTTRPPRPARGSTTTSSSRSSISTRR